MKGHLVSRGIRVSEERVRGIMRICDPLGVYQRTIRRNRTIRRRQYYVKYSNESWHIDANLKLVRLVHACVSSLEAILSLFVNCPLLLVRWGFVIRAGVDGKSRAAIYITVSSDNKSETHLSPIKAIPI